MAMVKKSKKKSKKKPTRAPRKRTSSHELKRTFERFKNHLKNADPRDNEDWSDPVKRGAAANEVLSFGSETAGQSESSIDNYGAPLRKAFQAIGLNPDNPHNWRVLLRIFAIFHFDRSEKDRDRVMIVTLVQALMSHGDKKYIAVERVAKMVDVDNKTVWNALKWAKSNFIR
jgi:hypothetical protein